MSTRRDTLLRVTSHLCSWAEYHSTSHLTGRTSVESPPTPEATGRRRRQTTCRRILGPLSCLGLGRRDLRRTQLGRWGREVGPSRCLELSLLAPLYPHPVIGLHCFPPGSPWTLAVEKLCVNGYTCLNAALRFPLLSRFKCFLIIISV